MESSGVPGRIHISEASAALLGDAFELESRGPIEVKGKGTMSTFFVVHARRASLVQDDRGAAGTTGRFCPMCHHRRRQLRESNSSSRPLNQRGASRVLGSLQ